MRFTVQANERDGHAPDPDFEILHPIVESARPAVMTPEILALSQAAVLLLASVAANYWLQMRPSGEASFTAEAMEYVLFP